VILRFDPDPTSSNSGNLISTYLHQPFSSTSEGGTYRTRTEVDLDLLLDPLARIAFEVNSCNQVCCGLVIIVPSHQPLFNTIHRGSKIDHGPG
jgi:hypothetical protein